jgi:hypothetical protein
VHTRARLRVDESVGETRALHAEVSAWRARWDTIDAIGGHHTQLDLLTDVVLGLVDEITARSAAIDTSAGIGETYDECRRQDRRLLHARRLWRWYADKLDQRAGPDDDARVQTLQAADEVVWSCWKTAFTALGEQAPAAPVPYLAPRFNASATPRTDHPDGLRPGADDLLRRHIEKLPIPVVGLPPLCARRPWWLILTAHETAHHVQFEAGDLERRTQERVVAAVRDATGDDQAAEKWRPWCRELFADACSVLLTGPAAIWAVRELETRAPAAMRTSPSLTYPPPLVRLAIACEVARRAGLPAESVVEAPDDEELRLLLDAVPEVAGALLAITSAADRPLRDLAEATVKASAARGGIAGWRAELLSDAGPVPRETLDAARFCAAAGVTAWQYLIEDEAHDPQAQDRLARRLRDILPQCREPGTRSAPTAPDAAGITRQFVTDLYEGDI